MAKKTPMSRYETESYTYDNRSRNNLRQGTRPGIGSAKVKVPKAPKGGGGKGC